MNDTLNTETAADQTRRVNDEKRALRRKVRSLGFDNFKIQIIGKRHGPLTARLTMGHEICPYLDELQAAGFSVLVDTVIVDVRVARTA